MIRIIKPYSDAARFIQRNTRAPFFPFSNDHMKQRFGHGTETFGLFTECNTIPVAYCHMATMKYLPSHINQILRNDVPTYHADHGILYTLINFNPETQNAGYASRLTKYIFDETKDQLQFKSLTTMSPYNRDRFQDLNPHVEKNEQTVRDYLLSGNDSVFNYHTKNGAELGDILSINDDYMIRYVYY